MQNVSSAGKSAEAGNHPGDCSHAPPIGVWIAVGFLTLAVVLLPYPSYLASSRDSTFAAENIRRIREFAAGRPGAHSVIMIGSSALHSGTFYDNKMDAFAASNGCPGVRFLRISQRGTGFRQTESVLTPALLAKPDLIVIQADVLLTDSTPTPYPVYLSDTLRSALSMTLGHKRPHRPNLLDDLDLEIEPEQHDAAFGRYAKALRERLTSPGPGRDKVASFLLRARRAGVRVAIVEMPRPEKVGSLIASIGDATYKAEQAWLTGSDLASHMNCPDQFQLDQFRDFIHLNNEGRARFAAWLVVAIRKELAGGSNGK
ncbi:MAG: hypothetical protein WCL44_11875 [bacterium]